MKRSTIHSVSVALVVAFVCGLTTSPALSCSFASENTFAHPNARESASESDEAELPANVLAPQVIRPLLGEMLERSVTFRRQCLMIRNAPQMHIAIELVPGLTCDNCLALSLVTKYFCGRVEVRMRISAPRAATSYAEIIGHEFEHAIEQIEGVDLRALASTRGSCVYRHADGSFETKRARQAGLAVAREFDMFRKSPGSAGSPVGQR